MPGGLVSDLRPDRHHPSCMGKTGVPHVTLLHPSRSDSSSRTSDSLSKVPLSALAWGHMLSPTGTVPLRASESQKELEVSEQLRQLQPWGRGFFGARWRRSSRAA